MTFSTIVADPPWEAPNINMRKVSQVDSQYDTMPTSAICDIPVGQWADPEGCMLWMWVTSWGLRDGLDVLDAWGFRYVTNLAWVKPGIGLGFWLRTRHELCLLAVKGSPGYSRQWKMGDIGRPQAVSVLEARRYRHSAKPEALQDRIEQVFDPGGRWLELFARRPRLGWTTWGNEIGYELSSEGVREL